MCLCVICMCVTLTVPPLDFEAVLNGLNGLARYTDLLLTHAETFGQGFFLPLLHNQSDMACIRLGLAQHWPGRVWNLGARSYNDFVRDGLDWIWLDETMACVGVPFYSCLLVDHIPRWPDHFAHPCSLAPNEKVEASSNVRNLWRENIALFNISYILYECSYFVY